MDEHTVFDWSRKTRTGLPEVVFAEGKTVSQIDDILVVHHNRRAPLLMTRLTAVQITHLEGITNSELSVDLPARLVSYRAPAPAPRHPKSPWSVLAPRICLPRERRFCRRNSLASELI